MGREAFITINCNRYSKKIFDIINLFSKIGWSYYDSNNNIEYLPLGDKDTYDWQKKHIEVSELKFMIDYKQSNAETIGLYLYYKNSPIGIGLLARSTSEIIIDLNINRQTYLHKNNSITDISWYMQTIVMELAKNGCDITYIKFEDFVG